MRRCLLCIRPARRYKNKPIYYCTYYGCCCCCFNSKKRSYTSSSVAITRFYKLDMPWNLKRDASLQFWHGFKQKDVTFFTKMKLKINKFEMRRKFFYYNNFGNSSCQPCGEEKVQINFTTIVGARCFDILVKITSYLIRLNGWMTEWENQERARRISKKKVSQFCHWHWKFKEK